MRNSRQYCFTMATENLKLKLPQLFPDVIVAHGPVVCSGVGTKLVLKKPYNIYDYCIYRNKSNFSHDNTIIRMYSVTLCQLFASFCNIYE